MDTLRIIGITLLLTFAVACSASQHNILKAEEEDHSNVRSQEIVGTGAHSSSLSSGDSNQQNTGVYVFRRQRRSAHLGTHFYRPVQVVQPVGVAPVQGYYHGHLYPQAQQLSNSHSQAQAVSANFGGNNLFGGGGSAISAAAASSGSGTPNQQLVPVGYGRK